MSLTSFNRDLLNDRLEQYQGNLERALEQHRQLSTKLHSIKVRFNRAVGQGKGVKANVIHQISSKFIVIVLF